MKTIGLIGGMSWESTAEYYRIINEEVKFKFGGLHSAKVIVFSLDFEPLVQLKKQDDWDGIANILSEAAKSLQAGGAHFFLLCTNTMHKVSNKVQASVDIPLLHIADATAEVLQKDGIKKVGLLGTAFTMEEEFYKERLATTFGLEVIVPDAQDRELVHRVIYNELCLGKVSAESKKEYLRIIEKLSTEGATAVILGCTEIGLLIKQEDTTISLYDTTLTHAKKAVEYAL